MTYIELINEFWKKNLVSPFSSTEIAFYFYLLHECDSSGWRNPLRLPTRKICFELDFRKDTITGARNSLKQRGLIDFKKGDRRAADPEYSILDSNGVLVEIAYQNSYQNAYQNSYQSPYQTTYQSDSPTPPINKEISSDEDIKKVGRSIDERRTAFYDNVSPYIGKYGQKMIDDFSSYWTKMKNDSFMRFEEEEKFSIAGRLATWYRNSMNTSHSVTNIAEKEREYGIDWQKVKKWYVGLGLVMERWTEGRKRAYISIIDSYNGDMALFKEAIIRFAHEVKQSDWILGLAGSPMRDFEWLFTEENFIRVIDGKYRKNSNLKAHESNSTREKDRHGTVVDESFKDVDYSENF